MNSSRKDHAVTSKRGADGLVKSSTAKRTDVGLPEPKRLPGMTNSSLSTGTREVEPQRATETSSSAVTPKIPIVGRRKMQGKVLKTGILKAKPEEASSSSGSSTAASKDSSSNAYLEEMKKYSEQLCSEERHARPLVK